MKHIDLGEIVEKLPHWRLGADGAIVHESSFSFRGSEKADGIKQAGFTILSEVRPKIHEHGDSGPVWSARFKPHIERMEHIVRTALRRRKMPRRIFSMPSLLATCPSMQPYKLEVLNETSFHQSPQRPSTILASESTTKSVRVNFILCHAFGALYPGERDCESGVNVFAVDETTCIAEDKTIELILVRSHFEWVDASDGTIPRNPVPAGKDMLSRPLYLTSTLDRSHPKWWMYRPGYIGLGMKGSRYVSSGKVKEENRYYVLCYNELGVDEQKAHPMNVFSKFSLRTLRPYMSS